MQISAHFLAYVKTPYGDVQSNPHAPIPLANRVRQLPGAYRSSVCARLFFSNTVSRHSSPVRRLKTV